MSATTEHKSILPEWDLTDLYTGMEDPRIEQDIQTIDDKIQAFSKKYRGTLVQISGDSLYEAVVEYEHICVLTGKIITFCDLLLAVQSTDMKVGAFYQTVREKLTHISSKSLFFCLEVNTIESTALEAKMQASKNLQTYRCWITDVREGRKYQLPDAVENILHEKSASGSMAWQRLFSQTMASLIFTVDGKKLNESEVLHLMTNRDAGVRERAMREFGRVLAKNIPTLTLITNTLAKDKEISDRVRGFKTPVSSRNLANFVEDEVVESLVSSVKECYGNISHRYYRLKAKWMGVESLNLWDRNAPLPQDTDNTTSYTEAVDLVLEAYGEFSPKLYTVAKQFFDNPWIDAGVKAGKRSGAFAHPCVPGIHPYLLLNYQGTPRDIMTLAHELGHGCHQILANQQGYLKSQTPLTLAETASVFGEMLVFQKLIQGEKNREKRRILLAGKVEDMINTIVRQISFFSFEYLVHNSRKQGEVSSEKLGEMWMQTAKESLGDSFIYEDFYKNFWSYIPHFVNSPFYVYAYAFGNCLVNSIYAVYKEGFTGFEEAYIDLLSAGGSKRHKALLKPFGLDATDKDFWSKGLAVVSELVDSLEDTF